MPQRDTARTLRGLIDVTRLARAGGSLPERLGSLAQTIGDSLGYETVAITLYRPAWDDFRVTAVSGREQARETLCGLMRTHDDYRPLLDDRFLRRGAYVIPAGAHDWSVSGTTFTPPVEPKPDDPDAWHPEDVLLVPLNATNGSLLGVMSVDEPASLRRPDEDELDVLVAVGEHVALAIEDAQAGETASRHAASLQHLLNVSSRLRESTDVNDILQAVVDNIRRALGFERVSIELTQLDGNGFTPRSSTGWGSAGPPPTGLTPATLGPLLDAEYEVEGCYLLPFEVARPRVTHIRYASALNGNGPHAWNRHWLVVPLTDREGALQGFIWADDPGDRLVPQREKMQALRLFANQASAALESAARFEELQFLADHDPLTRLPNRRAFVRQLDIETSRSLRYGHPFSLVLCDLDEFKELNDRAGHLVGDEELVRFAERLNAALRRTDYAFRIGGDEFALVLVPGADADARVVIERIRASADADQPVNASFGVAVYGEQGDSDDLFRRADEAMYAAKRSGGCVAVAA
ncbi:MAG: diguanylate cyclase domain-containing protein [Gaiellaceae bacterium]